MGGKAPKKSRKLDHGAAPDVTYSYHCLFLRFLPRLNVLPRKVLVLLSEVQYLKFRIT